MNREDILAAAARVAADEQHKRDVCATKRGYASRYTAQWDAEYFESLRHVPLYVYNCPECLFWHLTRRPQ